MNKTVRFDNVKFTPEVISEGFEKLKTFLKEDALKDIGSSLKVQFPREEWEYDNDSEFFSDYSRNPEYALIGKRSGNYGLTITFFGQKIMGFTTVEVKAPERSQIEDIHLIFSNNSNKCTLPIDEIKKKAKPIIFIGHGRSIQWRDLKDHLQDKHEYKVEAYEVGARAGHTIRDILDDMLTKSSFALLVMTGEDKGEDGVIRARENVIHEVGLFQGRLGFPRAIVLLEEGTNEFSNIHGIQQIKFSKDNIRETFGDVLATLRREFDICEE